MKIIVLSLLLTCNVCNVKGQGQITVADDSGTANFSCLKGNTTLTLTCDFSVSLTTTVDWSKDGVLQVTCSDTVNNDCSSPPAFTETRYTFTSDVAQEQFFFNINPATVGTDDGLYTCQHGADIATYTITSCKCDSIESNVANSVVSTTAVSQGTVVAVSCEAGYTISGDADLTCMNNGEWDKPYPACRTTTTSTTSTTTASLPTSMTTTSTTTPTTTSLSTTTTSTSLNTTTTSTSLPTTTKTTAASTTATSTTAASTMTTSTTTIASTTTTTTATTTVPSTLTSSAITSGPNTTTNDKGLITMIIVVSVIGGILILAIFSIIFLLWHWKSCFRTKVHRKHGVHTSHYRNQRRQHRKRYISNASGGDSTIQSEHAMKGYYFYSGEVKNPIFQNSPVRNNYYPNQEHFHIPQYNEKPPEYHHYSYNWDEMDRF